MDGSISSTVNAELSTEVPVILLVGGMGTRMGADAGDLPKHLVPVGGRPILWHVMRLYSHFGHNDFVFPLGARGESFRRYFLDFRSLNYPLHVQLGDAAYSSETSGAETKWNITLFDAGLSTNKGARVRLAAQRSSSPRFMVTYGDGIGDIDISAVLAFHRKHGRLATITGYQPFSQYGMLDVDDQGRVREMREKPRLPQWVNAGFMVFERAALDFFGVDDGVDLEKDVLPKLVAGGELMMYRHAGYWSSMDTFKDAQVLSDAWDAGAPWKLWSE